MNGFYNFGCGEGHYLGDMTDCTGAAKKVQDLMPSTVAQYFQGNGSEMCMGGDFYTGQCGDDSNPVKRAYVDWMDNSSDICWPARPSWDPLTLYAAIVGPEEALLTGEAGTDIIDEAGHENWDSSETDRNEANLIFSPDVNKQNVTDIFNKILCEGNKEGAQTFLQ